MDKTPTFITGLSQWHPINCKAREAMRIAAITSAGKRRERRDANRIALQAETQTNLNSAAMVARREAALAAGAAATSHMPPPRLERMSAPSF